MKLNASKIKIGWSIKVMQLIFKNYTNLWYREHVEAAEAISSLRVWKEVTIQGGLPGWMLDHKFRHNLKVALLGGYVHIFCYKLYTV